MPEKSLWPLKNKNHTELFKQVLPAKCSGQASLIWVLIYKMSENPWSHIQPVILRFVKAPSYSASSNLPSEKKTGLEIIFFPSKQLFGFFDNTCIFLRAKFSTFRRRSKAFYLSSIPLPLVIHVFCFSSCGPVSLFHQSFSCLAPLHLLLPLSEIPPISLLTFPAGSCFRF